MKRILSLIIGLWSGLALPAMASQDVELIEVVFAESEPGLEDYRSRLLLGERYLRLDDGSDGGDFILFDRKTTEIHSFNHEDGTHLHIPAKQASRPDADFRFETRRAAMPDAPSIDQRRPVQHTFIADGMNCRTSVNVEGLLEQVRQALVAYEQALVSQAMQSLARMPTSMRSACYMANNYVHATAYLEAGFPLYVEDYEGARKRLQSFDQVTKPAGLMAFPEGYRLYYATQPGDAVRD